MGELSPIQLKRIEQYRAQHGDFVSSNDAIINKILKEMEEAGVVYEGFENLIKGKNKTKQPKPETPTPLEPEKQTTNYSVFMNYSVPQWQPQEKTRELNGFEKKAIEFLQKMLGGAKDSILMQDLREGNISVAKLWGFVKNSLNTQYSRENIDAAIKETEADILRLVMAGQGQILDKLGNTVEFATMFKEVRGVDYNPIKVMECDNAAKTMAQVETCKRTIEALKAKLTGITSGTMTSRMDTKGTTQGLLEIFQLLCPDGNGGVDANAVNELLANIEGSDPNNSALKYGTGMRLKNVNGEWKFIVTNDSSSTAPITTEHVRMLENTLTTALEKVYAASIGVEFDDTTSLEDVKKLSDEKYLAYQKDYETKFANAFGQDDLKILAQQYVEGQQTADMIGDTVINIASMATMFVGSGMLLKGVQGGVKGFNLVTKSAKGAKLIDGVNKFTQVVQKSNAMNILQMVQLTQPMQGLRTFTSDAVLDSIKSFFTSDILGEELTDEEKQAREIAFEQLGQYGMTMSESAMWMVLGMASGAVGDKARLFLKQRGLAKVVKDTGKSIDDIVAIYKSGHLPKELAASFARMETIATASGSSLEFVADIALTYVGNQAIYGNSVSLNDVLMSINGVLIGAAMQKKHLQESREQRLTTFKTMLKEDNPNIKPNELEIKANTLLELSELAKSKLAEKLGGKVLEKDGESDSEKIDENGNLSAQTYAVSRQGRSKIEGSEINTEKQNNTSDFAEEGFISDIWNKLKNLTLAHKNNARDKVKFDLISLVETNPAEQVAQKVQHIWQERDLQTGTRNENIDLFNLDPYAGLKDNPPLIDDEATSLILKNKLSEALKTKYEYAKDFFKNIPVKYFDEINRLANEHKNDIGKFAEGYIAILVKEVGLDISLTPRIIVNEKQPSSGRASWENGTIEINPKDIKDAKSAIEILSHEIIHILQFKDYIAETGITGIKDFVDNYKPIKNKQEAFDTIIQKNYVQALLKFVNDKNVEENSLDSYLNSVYLNDASHGVGEYAQDSNFYKQKRTELEAYYIGNNATLGYNEANSASLDASNQQVKSSRASEGLISEDGGFTLSPKGIIEAIKGYEYPWITKKIDEIIDEIENDRYHALKLEQKDKDTIHYIAQELRKKNISLEKLGSYKHKYLIRYLKESSDDYTTSDINDIIDLLSKDLSYSKLFELDYYNNYAISITSKELRAIVNACKNLTDEQIGTALGRGKKSRIIFFNDPRTFNYDTSNLHFFAKILSRANDLEIKTLENLIEISNSRDADYIATLTNEKVDNLVAVLKDLSAKEKAIFKEEGLNTDDLINRLAPVTTGFEVKTNKSSQNKFLKAIIGNNTQKAEEIIAGDTFKSFLSILEVSNSSLPLKYSRENFIKDINLLLDKLTETEKIKVLEHFNIKLDGNDFTGFLKLEDFDYSKFNSSSQNILKEIKSKVDDFIINNEVSTSNPEIKRVLDDLIKGFPEFTSILGRVDTDNYIKPEIHTLQVLSDAISHPEYKNLSDFEKTMLKFSILMHNIGKTTTESTTFTRSILDKFNLSQEMKEGIVNIVKNHNWRIFPQGFYLWFRTPAQQNVARIIGDTLNVTGKSTEPQGAPLSKIDMMDKEIVHNKHLSKYPTRKYTLEDGRTVNVRIADLRKANYNDDASQYGWYGGQSLGETVIQVHNCEDDSSGKAVDKIKNIISSYLNPNKDMTLSTTVTNLKSIQKNGYGNISIILSTAKGNNVVLNAKSASNASGGKKNFLDFIGAASENVNTSNKSLEDVNEVFALNPKIEQIALKSVTPENVPLDLIELAAEYDIPLLLLP